MSTSKNWKVLLVDDDITIHSIIEESLKNKIIRNRNIEIHTALDSESAKKALNKHTDTALIFIDISMHTVGSGLALVKYIREVLKNDTLRIILVASEPEPMPAEDIIEHYDVNDYVHRDDIETKRLFTIIRTSLKQYIQFKELKQNRDELYEQLTTNPVTKLPNRIKLSHMLDQYGDQCLVLINIDDFSLINDKQGFEFGDEVLREFGKFLQKKYAKIMDIFHLQADLFALLCHKDIDKLQKTLTSIKEEIEKNVLNVYGNKIHITASIGIALHEEGNLIQKAEFALKEARIFGKNNLMKYSSDLNIIQTIHANSKWSQIIREAFKENNILAYFQPIEKIKTGEIVKYEALVRLKHNDKIHSPIKFLDAALYSGQIFEIFKFMFEEVCKKTTQNPESFTLNISEYDLKHPLFKEYIFKTIKKYNVNPSRITFEVLEHNSISHNRSIQELINELHDYGFKIAIDDFGAHCSNFSQLNNLKIDFIKLDGAFVKNIVDDVNSQIISKTIIDFSHQKNIPVIAEFVCSQDVYEYIKNLGVEFAQGYTISAPTLELFKKK